nr:hypothetical protein [uncultured Oscillibacter sp.]
MMKTWKRLVSGLLGLTLAASLACPALAAEGSAKTAAKEEPKAEAAAEPAGQFSKWFPRLKLDPAAPEAAEAALARMGTAIQQSKTVGGVTATLNAAVWDGGTLRLSLVVKAPNIPKEVTKGTSLYTEECSITLPEEDWREYLRKDEEAHGEGLSKELLEKSIQNFLDMGQAGYWNRVNVLNFPLVSREKDTLTFEAWMSFKDYLKQPEITLHLENIATYEDGKGDKVIWQDGKRTGPGPKDVILKGPFDFTFTLEEPILPMHYQGAVPITEEGIPFRFTGFKMGVFQMDVDYDLLAQMNPVRVTRPEGAPPAPAPDPDKLSEESVRKVLHGIIKGLWTKDGVYVDLSQQGGGLSLITSEDGTANGSLGVTYPYPIDPAGVAAVDLNGTRVELGSLKPAAEQAAPAPAAAGAKP